ncbi:hypothetical protein [Salinicoccus sp. HZC-1]|uniref:hypothetical protein n=1 Tax=Salinicoccus sp. HZC-1 TaxID=3385497 RepID=UPI00398B4B13
MKDDGFMMLDAVLAMLIFSIIIGILVPALMMIKTTVAHADNTLEFSRSLYIEILKHDAPDDFKHEDYIMKGDSICDKENMELCVSIK